MLLGHRPISVAVLFPRSLLPAHTRPFTDRLSQRTAKGLYLVSGGEGEVKVWGRGGGEFGPGQEWYRDVPDRFGQQGLLSRCRPG